MGIATQVTAIRPGAWEMERDTVPQQQDRRGTGHLAGRFAATLNEAVARSDGPGRAWTETPPGGGPLHPALIGGSLVGPAEVPHAADLRRIYRA